MAIAEIRNRLTEHTAKFAIVNSYQTFVHSEYGNFDFHSEIGIMLSTHTCIIQINREQTGYLEKSYNDQLTETEINAIVKQEMVRHKAFIESKVEER